jgi:spheroidene monooxygenase
MSIRVYTCAIWTAKTMTCASLSLFRFGTLAARAWVLGQMGLARLDLPRTPGLKFWKLCGSGTGEGFTPVPNTAVWAILAEWESEAVARARIAHAPVFARWRAHAAESWTIFLEPLAARGRWGGVAAFGGAEAGGCPWSGIGAKDGAVAALTRATLRPSTALRFWGRVPDISQAIGADENVIFKIGIGELPLMHQVTFSIWPDTASMAHFAREDGPHARAIRAVRAEGWFREELYARFRILGDEGLWEGKHPLAAMETAA